MPKTTPIPAGYLSPAGMRAVQARAKELRDYLWARRQMRQVVAAWGAR